MPATQSDKQLAKQQRQLKKIISKMKKVQRQISAEQQPASMHQLDKLSELGRQYARLIEQLQAARR